MMDRRSWLVLPKEPNQIELTEDESYAKLLVLMQEAPAIIEEGRGCRLTEKQAAAIQKFIAGLIEARARVKLYECE